MVNADGEPIAVGLKEAMVRNVQAVLDGSHHPQRVLETLRTNIESGCAFTAQVMLNGLEEALNRKKESAVNAGVICALLASMTIGLALDLPNMEHRNEDNWSERRETLAQAYMILMAASTYLSLAGVLLSLCYVDHLSHFMNDAEDQLWYGSTIPSEPISQMTVWSTFSLGFGLAAGLVVVNKDTAADAAFAIFVVVLLSFCFYWLTCLFLNCRRSSRTLADLKAHFLTALPASLDDAAVVRPES